MSEQFHTLVPFPNTRAHREVPLWGRIANTCYFGGLPFERSSDRQRFRPGGARDPFVRQLAFIVGHAFAVRGTGEKMVPIIRTD